MPDYVLFVEDDTDDVHFTLTGLEAAKLDIPIEVAHDGVEAMVYLEKCLRGARAIPAVILMDLKMPKMGGLEVLRRLRATPGLRDIPVAILTSSDYATDREQALSLGAQIYMLKPNDLHGYNEITAALRELLSASGSAARKQ